MIDDHKFEIYFLPSKIFRKYWHIAVFNPLKKTMGYIKYEEVPDKKSKTRVVRRTIESDGFNFTVVWMDGYGTLENMIERAFDVVGDYHLPRRDAQGFIKLYAIDEATQFKPSSLLVSYNTVYYDSARYLKVNSMIKHIEKRMLDDCKLEIDKLSGRTLEYYEPYSVKLFHQRVYQKLKKSWKDFASRPDLHFNLVDTIDTSLLTTFAYWAQCMEELEEYKRSVMENESQEIIARLGKR